MEFNKTFGTAVWQRRVSTHNYMNIHPNVRARSARPKIATQDAFGQTAPATINKYKSYTKLNYRTDRRPCGDPYGNQREDREKFFIITRLYSSTHFS